MLTELREKSQSFLIYVLFGILIFVFVFFFGPQSDGCQPAGSQIQLRVGWAADVYGDEITQEEIESNVRRQLGRNTVSDADLAAIRRAALLQAIDQTVVAGRARALGLVISEEELTAYIVSKDNPDFPYFTDPTGAFDYERYTETVGQQFGAPLDLYRTMKERELLIQRFVEFLASQIKVSDPEIREAFEQESRRWNLEYLAIDPANLPADVVLESPTDEAAKKFAADNAEKVKAYYEAHKADYDHDTEVRVRRILVKAPAEPKKGEGEEKAPELSAEDAAKVAAARTKPRIKIDELHAKAAAPDADFAQLATDGSEGFYQRSAGDMGWRTKENSAPEEYTVYTGLAVGAVSAVQRSDIGFWFVKAEEVKPEVHRTLEEATPEIGRQLAAEAQRFDAAKRLAAEILAKGKAGTPLAELVPAPTPPAVPVEGDAPEEPEVIAEVSEPATLETTGMFSDARLAWDRIPGIGQSAELARQLDALTLQSPWPAEPIEVEGRLYVVHLKERIDPDAKALGERRDAIEGRLRRDRERQLIGPWREMLFGGAQHREYFRRAGVGALVASLPDPNSDPEIAINDAAFPAPTAAPN